MNEYGGKVPILTTQTFSESYVEASEIKSSEFATNSHDSREVFYTHLPKVNEEFCKKVYERIDAGRTNEIESSEK